MAAARKGTVCVTGAGGFLGSWVVNHLLCNNYLVHGTVRDPSDEKNAHLNKLDKAPENLKLLKADLLDYMSLFSAFEGCSGVFHVACPVPITVTNPEVDIIEPAVRGTLNVLKACSDAKVKRVVVVSSGSAILDNPSWPEGQVMDERCWSDKEHCRKNNNWYNYSKTEAETQALEYAKRSRLDVLTVCPSFIIGPLLQPTINATSTVLIKLLKANGCQSVDNRFRVVVDVRDVAEALVLVYEKPEAEGRYICTSHALDIRDLVEKLRSIYPYYNYPKYINGEGVKILLSSEKLQRLGWSYRTLEETLIDSVDSYRRSGILD